MSRKAMEKNKKIMYNIPNDWRRKMDKENKLTIHHIFWYFIIFSIIGLIIETLYCYITTGIWESRKGLIWGPFCPVYGVSGAVLLMCLNLFKSKKSLRLFIYGFAIGSIAEYLLSYGLEAIYGIRFWEYSYLTFNLNGRICLLFSIYWGLLSVILVKFVQPLIDKFVNRMNDKIRNIIEVILFIFFSINCLFTIWGIQTYQNRVVYNQYNSNNNSIIQQIENNYFTNDRMSKTFPNLRIKDEKGKEIWIRTLIPND